MANAQFQIRKAQRKRLLARIGLAGPSGGGKTYSLIEMLRGLVGPEGRILLIDTEQESSSMYEHLQNFDILPFAAPYSPQRYMAAMEEAERYFDSLGVPPRQRGLGIDQISHAWSGPGGVLAYVDNAKTASGNKQGFNAWKDATPIQQAFVERMLAVKAHLAVTMRSKSEWVIEKDERGKSTPKKIGMSPVQRDGIEYEFQVMIDLTDGGNASVSKDRTGLLMGTFFKPSVEVGARLRAFLDEGEEEEVPPAKKVAANGEPPQPRPVPPPPPQPTTNPAPAPDQAPPAPTEAPPTRHEAAAPEQKAATPPDPSETVIDQAQQKTLVAAAKATKMPYADFNALVMQVAGVKEASRIPSRLFMDVLKRIVPQQPDELAS